MRVRYVIKLARPIILDDHWPIKILGGKLNFLKDGNKAHAIEIVMAGQPTSQAPKIIQSPDAPIKTTIVGGSDLFPILKIQLESAFSYLKCYFDVDLQMDEVETEYFAETEPEKSEIDIHSFTTGMAERPLPLTYDFFTRAIMAAETNAGPSFEATLVAASREALFAKRYIDSFRYSFLLIESLYGGGKFKTDQLVTAFSGNTAFVGIIKAALNQQTKPKRLKNSDTETLLASKPPPEAVIAHLVEKRGFYFHGNVKRKDAWRPDEQERAEALALLALDVALLISQEAAAEMFDEKYAERHFLNAKEVGAIMTMKVDFQFREPEDKFDRNHAMTINVPGTKVTALMARYVAQQFLTQFEHGAPVAALKSASCVVKDTGQKVFEMKFHFDGTA